jgi:hypothetical protein
MPGRKDDLPVDGLRVFHRNSSQSAVESRWMLLGGDPHQSKFRVYAPVTSSVKGTSPWEMLVAGNTKYSPGTPYTQEEAKTAAKRGTREAGTEPSDTRGRPDFKTTRVR